ncbi:hypothetical protein [Cryptosporangium phraense]|uniref:Conjugal transfer protein TrbC n=1 Tax=Cryptosporangium phraense TaxID=2593070 RepID=A0A545ANI3_9ACTN|nr:hypothetical protein [Cryptosporangium phraense]TQS42821.1 hypothetical protein FL583_22470 [Cryptosporangium phraense]
MPRAALTGAFLSLSWLPDAAVAAPAPGVPTPKSLPEVISSLQLWVLGIIGSIATLYAVLAAVYLTTAGGSPEQEIKGKTALRNALVGYALAILAPVLLQIAKSIVAV